MKRIILILMAIFSREVGFAQTLNIQETIDYINKNLYQDKEGTYYKRISLTTDGILTIHHGSKSSSTEKMDISEVRVGSLSATYFSIGCKNQNHGDKYSEYQPKCIQVEDEFSKSNSGSRTYINIGVKDIYNNKKLYNAFIYLFALVDENGTYIRKDDDPFAPNKFNSINSEIINFSANKYVKLENINGVYYLTAIIGNTTNKFIFDSGASDVLISDKIENELIKNKTISKENYLAPALYKIANGYIIQCRRILLPTIKIGNYTVKDVLASVSSNNNVLLLGKSFLDKFSSWTIDNNNQTLKLEK
jgi:aspartyl protease family protein